MNGRIKCVNNLLINTIDLMKIHVIKILDIHIDGFQMRDMDLNVKNVIHY